MPISLRQSARIECAIDIIITHPTHSQIARVIDLSEGGAKIQTRNPLPEGSKFRLDVDGYSAWAKVIWREDDRIGVSFDVPLEAGHPFTRTIARNNIVAMSRPVFTSRAFGRRAA